MITKKSFVLFINKYYSKKLGLKHDYIGEHTKFKLKKEINVVLICLDITLNVVKEAIDKKADLIISHHPLIFGKFNDNKKIAYKKIIFDALNKYNISIYTTHTNYDASNQGMNYAILQQLGYNNIKSYSHSPLIKTVKLDNPITTIQMIDKLKNVFNYQNISYCGDLNKKLNYLALCSGAGGSFIDKYLNKYLYITGELKWSDWILAEQNKQSVIVVGHYMEDFFVDNFSSYFKKSFNDKIKIYKIHINNPINYI